MHIDNPEHAFPTILVQLHVFFTQESADSNFSRNSSELSLDEDKEATRRETERQALAQLEKARVSVIHFQLYRPHSMLSCFSFHSSVAWYDMLIDIVLLCDLTLMISITVRVYVYVYVCI